MKIAVIGEYDSPQYKHLLEIVSIAFPLDKALDLSIHTAGDFKTRQAARFEEIKSCHAFVYDYKWEESTEIRQDITCAQKAGKDGFFYCGGKFKPLPCQV